MLVCALCGAATAGERQVVANGRPVCVPCASRLVGEVQAGRVVPAALLGLGGALLGGAVWAGLVIWMRFEIAYAAILVGWLAGQGVRLGAGTGRGPMLQRLAAGLAAFGLVAAKYFIFAEYAVRKLEGTIGFFHPEILSAFVRIAGQIFGIFDLVWIAIAVTVAYRIPAAPQLGIVREEPPPPATAADTEPAPAPVTERPTTEAPSHASAARGGVVAAAVTAAMLLLGKGKLVLVFLLTKAKVVFGAFKFGKVLGTGWTMIATAWVYATLYGWPFGVGLVALILVHELGHGAAARSVGLPVGAPVFIPFVGAFIALKDKPKSTWQDFVMAAGGPVAGSLGGVACLALASSADDPVAGLLRALGFFAFTMNLFNLTPVWQLDGHRMVGAIPPTMALGGVVMAGAIWIVTAGQTAHPNPVGLIVIVVGLWQAGERWWRTRGTRDDSALGRLERGHAAALAVHDDIPSWQRTVAALTYFVLLALLVSAIHELGDQVLRRPA